MGSLWMHVFALECEDWRSVHAARLVALAPGGGELQCDVRLCRERYRSYSQWLQVWGLGQNNITLCFQLARGDGLLLPRFLFTI